MQIAIPAISHVAHIHDEIQYLHDLIHLRIQRHTFSTKLYTKTTPEHDIVRLLARYHKYPPFPTKTITSIVAACIATRSPITICFAFTNCRSRSTLKFFDQTMLPHYGWLYLISLLTEIEQYGQLCYTSTTGFCFRFVILDETPFVQEILFDNTQYHTILHTNHTILQHWIQQFPVDIRIIPLKTSYFHIDQHDIHATNLSFDLIYSYACSLGFDRIDRNPILMDPLYTINHKNAQHLIELIGPETWEKASEKTAIISVYATYRKEQHLAQRLVHTANYIDTSVLRARHRFNLKTTTPALLAHGMPVLRRDHDGTFWINIVPEYRMKQRYPDAERVLLQTSELTNTMNARMTLWDMSVVGVSRAASSYDAGSWGNMAHGNTFDASEVPEAYIVNVTIPAGLSGSVQAAAVGERVIGGTVSNEQVSLWGLSLQDGDEGDLLFQNTWNAPASWAAGNLSVSVSAISLEDNVMVIGGQQNRMYYGFDLDSGEYLWEIDDPEHYMNFFQSTSAAIAEGKLFSTGAAGILYCYDVANGDLLWTYDATDDYSEILWANNWWINTLFITDGKIYCGHEEHSPIDPRPRGAPFFAIDIETGEEVFRIDGAFRQTHWGAHAIIGDSIIATMNTYDQRIYGIGKGASQLTAKINDDVIALGSSAQVTGTVMDVSPGTQSTALTTRFPSGVPAIADEDMSEWMKYVYMQFERPA